jgi:hypothetical protein
MLYLAFKFFSYCAKGIPMFLYHFNFIVRELCIILKFLREFHRENRHIGRWYFWTEFRMVA